MNKPSNFNFAFVRFHQFNKILFVIGSTFSFAQQNTAKVCQVQGPAPTSATHNVLLTKHPTYNGIFQTSDSMVVINIH